MSELTLLLSLLIAGIVPRLTLRYLQPILMQVLHRLCENTQLPGGALRPSAPAASGTPTTASSAASSAASSTASSAVPSADPSAVPAAMPALADQPPEAAPQANSGPEFWWRILNVMAISGSMLLVLTFGYSDGYFVTLNDFLRRTLWLVTLGVFLSVGVVALQIWSRTAPASAAAPRLPVRGAVPPQARAGSHTPGGAA